MDKTSRWIATVAVLGLTAIAISIPVAQGGIRPDDRAVRGVSVVAVQGTGDLDTPVSRPDDRAVRGVSAAVQGTGDLSTPVSRPDDRAVRGVVALSGSDGTAVRRVNVVASAPLVAPAADQGFAWMEAGLGASTMLVFLCVLAGVGLLIARQRKPALS